MSLLVIVTVSSLLILTISQFGGRLSARNSLIWWFVTGFLLISIAFPHALDPLASFLGIALVSNLVMASLILFLYLQSLESSVENTNNSRKLRSLVSRQASRQFKRKRSIGGTGTIKPIVVLPCYNEAESLPTIIPHLTSLLSNQGIDFCFVDDGSSDDSLNILKSQCPNHFVSHDTNIGVSGVLMTGFAIANNHGFTHVIQCDSDGQHPIDKIEALLSFCQEHDLDLAIGSRFCEGASSDLNKQSTTSTRILGIGLIRFSLAFFGLFSQVKDPTSGFRVYGKRAFSILTSNMPDDYPEPESLAILAVKKMKIAEMPVKMKPRELGTSSISSWKSAHYMIKVFSSLIGLRLRSSV